MKNIVISGSAVDRWWEKNIFFGEKYFSSLKFVLLKKGLNVLVWIINGVHRIDFKNTIYNSETLFFLKMCFYKQLFFIEVVISGGTKDWCRKLKHVFQVFFYHRKLISWKKNFDWFGKIWQGGYTGKMIKK